MSETQAPSSLCWFEIPVLDLERAQRFYRAVFGCSFSIEPGASGVAGITLAMFEPKRECPAVNGCLIHGTPLKPSAEGAVIYFNVGPDLSETLARAEAAGTTVLVPKTGIGSYGSFAHILDCEGNRIGIHSQT